MFLGRLFGGLRKRLPKSPPALPVSLIFSEQGITLTDTQAERTIPWPSITRIGTYKRDLYAYDMVCLLVETDEQGVELNEEMDGFADCFGAFEQNLKISPAWYLEVGFPAFETKPAIIYDKHAQEGVTHE